MMKSAIVTALGAVSLMLGSSMVLGAQAPRSAALPMSVLLTPDEIEDVRRRARDFSGTIRRCSAELGHAPSPVSVFAPDPHYTETGVNTTANTAEPLADDAVTAYRQGVCHVVTGDERFAAVAQRIIDAWARTLTDVATGQGKASFNFNLPYMIAAASWVRGVNGWKGEAFDRFLRQMVLPNSTSDNPNNHGMWGGLMESSAATYLDDSALFARARARWTEIFKGAAAPDGTLIREIERSGTTDWRGGPDRGVKGMAYTHYFLLPASLAAKVFADRGQPVWRSESGVLLQAAFLKAAGWTLRPETFPFFASNNGQLEAVRSVAYFPLLLRYYPSVDATTVLQQGDIGDGGFLLPKLFALRPSQR